MWLTEVPLEGHKPRCQKDDIMCKKCVSFVSVLSGADVGGSSSTTSKSSMGEGTVSWSVRSNVCRRSNALCFCNVMVGGKFDEQLGSCEWHLKYNWEMLRKKTSGGHEMHCRRPGGTFVWLVAISLNLSCLSKIVWSFEIVYLPSWLWISFNDIANEAMHQISKGGQLQVGSAHDSPC